jgi:hypothetical protein
MKKAKIWLQFSTLVNVLKPNGNYIDICKLGAIFVKTIVTGAHSDRRFGWRGEGISYRISMPGKMSRNAVRAFALLSKNFRNGVPSQKFPCVKLIVTLHFVHRVYLWFHTVLTMNS